MSLGKCISGDTIIERKILKVYVYQTLKSDSSISIFWYDVSYIRELLIILDPTLNPKGRVIDELNHFKWSGKTRGLTFYQDSEWTLLRIFILRNPLTTVYYVMTI